MVANQGIGDHISLICIGVIAHASEEGVNASVLKSGSFQFFDLKMRQPDSNRS